MVDMGGYSEMRIDEKLLFFAKLFFNLIEFLKNKFLPMSLSEYLLIPTMI